MANKVWKDGTRRGIAYVEGKETAERVMRLAGRLAAAAAADAEEGPKRQRRIAVKPPLPVAEVALEGAMAVYSDRKGRPFAWQIPFPIACWEQVTAEVGPAPL